MPRSSPGPAQDWAQGHQLPQPCIQTPSAPPSVSRARSCPPSSRGRVQIIPCSLVLRIRASTAGARVQSLVGEPISCKPGRAKTKKCVSGESLGEVPWGLQHWWSQTRLVTNQVCLTGRPSARLCDPGSGPQRPQPHKVECSAQPRVQGQPSEFCRGMGALPPPPHPGATHAGVPPTASSLVLTWTIGSSLLAPLPRGSLGPERG